MTCKQCGAENPATNRFCIKCGAELPTLATADVGGTNQGPGSNPAGYTPPTAAPNQPAYGSYTSTGMVWRQDQLVGFGTRLVAVVIDIFALAILYGILNAIHLGGLDSLAGTIYFIYCWSTTGQTLGDMAMKIKVARTDGQALSIGTGILRYVGYVISIAVIFIGVLWVLWDPNKQGWHDKIANTVVVRAQ